MGLTSTQGYQFRLVANGTQLDLFKDETIRVSNNVTGLFDVDILPSEFSRTITVPGTKINNAFFEHVYDIAVNEPYLFETNVKVPAYFDFGGIYLVQGYLQLLKVNVLANKFVDSYEVSIFGTLSSFSRDLNRTYLTDLTGSLAKYNHFSFPSVIASSWVGGLHSGSVVYPLADYGQQINYSAESFFGNDDIEGALNVQNFKPAIRVKAVWDAIFEEFGYTYTGSFWEQEFLNDIYLFGNNSLKYPEYPNIDLETYGQIKISAISGSGTSNVSMSADTTMAVKWYNIESDPSGFVGANSQYEVQKLTRLRGTIDLNFKVMSTGAGNSAPQFYLHMVPVGASVPASTTNLVEINNYMQAVVLANTATVNTTYNLQTRYNTATVPAGDYYFALEYRNYNGSNMQIVLDPGDSPKGALTVGEVCQGADGRLLEMARNMPFGTNGIKCIDFVKGLQRKFNLVIYPSKTKQNQFIVETFNKWYKQGKIKDFNRYINLDDKIEVIPANNLAVNKLEFGDTLDNDYISQQFSKGANREYGKTYYVDTQNFFSQGEFKVQSGFASSPLVLVPGSGISGSAGSATPTNTLNISIDDSFSYQNTISCLSVSYNDIYYETVVRLVDNNGTEVVNTGFPITVVINYTQRSCYSAPSNVFESFVINTGQSQASYTYGRNVYVDCGQGSCEPETQDIQCISSITGQSLPIYTSSPFNNMC
jgi:hypothetical protein